ncbi:MAG: Transcriptional regulator, LuxR family protein [Myxococcales bacterium]|nr:Transcriptional regulator, LuxR family protein [Myxococcales bacterium]
MSPVNAFISQRAFRAAVELARSAGIPDEAILTGVPTSDTLPGRKKRVSWDRYCDLVACMQTACGGPLALEQMVADSYHRVLPELRFLAGTVLTPMALTEVILRFSMPHFPLTCSVAPLADGRVLTSVRLHPGVRGAPPFFRGCIGSARGVTGHLSLPMAEVDGEISPTHANLATRLPPPRIFGAAIAGLSRTAKYIVRRLLGQPDSFLGLGHGDVGVTEVNIGSTRRLDQGDLDKIETYGLALSTCTTRDQFVDTLLNIVGHELGCARALLLRRSPKHAGYDVLGGAAADEAGVIRIHSLRAGGFEVGRLETSPPRDTHLLDAMVPWMGMGLANWVLPELSSTTVSTGSATLRERLHRASDAWHLNARQAHILESLIRGSSNKEIARELELVEKTIEYHVAQIFKRAEARSRAQLARHFFELVG